MRLQETDTRGFKTACLNLIYDKVDYQVVRKRSTSDIIIGGKRILRMRKQKSMSLDSQQKKNILTAFRIAKIQATDYIMACGCKIEPIEKRHPCRFSNKELYYTLDEGQEFYYIDINRCYWSVAKNMGWIKPNTYEKYMRNKDFKLFCNMALAGIIAAKTVQIVRGGHIVGEYTEENQLHRILYSNLRHTVYNFMGDLCDILGWENVIRYEIDGIYIFEKDILTVQKYFNNLNLRYSILKCEKMNNSEMLVGDGEIKKIR